jgi:LDH2 family malate/lactate/ureidoglycolate dehydrogenase
VTDDRFDAIRLRQFAAELLAGAGLAPDRADIVAGILVRADLMGHDTHGLQLLPKYLEDLDSGRMARDGDPETVADRGGALTWDGRYLPGPWLVHQAIELACERVRQHSVVTVVIRRSHHIACLAAYLKPVTDRGLVVLLMSSDPSVKSVAPFGAAEAVYTPNPIAAGFPTDGAPLLLDVSTSITTNGLTGRLHGQGARLPHPWLQNSEGEASDDPAVLFADPPGSILPVGGSDHGHKGFALGILVEALTAALGGFGRADCPTHWGASVFIQVIDPEAFGGRDAFARETGFFANACRAARPRPGGGGVRLPGERGLALERDQQASGVRLHPGILEGLRSWADKLGVAPPQPDS